MYSSIIDKAMHSLYENTVLERKSALIDLSQYRFTRYHQIYSKFSWIHLMFFNKLTAHFWGDMWHNPASGSINTAELWKGLPNALPERLYAVHAQHFEEETQPILGRNKF